MINLNDLWVNALQLKGIKIKSSLAELSDGRLYSMNDMVKVDNQIFYTDFYERLIRAKDKLGVL